MGRRNATAQEKELKGRRPGYDSGGRKIPPQPQFVRIAPEIPIWLSEYAKIEWKRIVPALEEQGLLKEIDQAALANYCEVYSTFRQATEDINANGISMTVTSTTASGASKTSVVRNPAVDVQKQCSALMRQWCIEFGLTPRAEVGLATKNDNKEEEFNPFE